MINRHFLDISDFSTELLIQTLNLAQILKQNLKQIKPTDHLNGKQVALLFEKPSLRTRMSFELGIKQLGGRVVQFKADEVGIGDREPISDMARVFSRMVDCVMIRANRHQDIQAFAQYSSVPIVNGLSDVSHPCQALADLLTIREYKTELAGLKMCYIGDANNVCRSLAQASDMVGIDFVVCSPDTYTPTWSDTQHTLIQDPSTAVKDADVVYTDTWVSMGDEAEAQSRRQSFSGFTVTPELMQLAKPEAIFMHCLPAHRGDEVVDAVIEGPQSVVFDQAENRLHAQKALLVKLLT